MNQICIEQKFLDESSDFKNAIFQASFWQLWLQVYTGQLIIQANVAQVT